MAYIDYFHLVFEATLIPIRFPINFKSFLEHREHFSRPLLGVEADLRRGGVQLVLEPVRGAHGGGEPDRVGEYVGVVIAVRLK